jgi:hypothetical protein
MLRARPFKNTVKARAERLVTGTGWLPKRLRIEALLPSRHRRMKATSGSFRGGDRLIKSDARFGFHA